MSDEDSSFHTDSQKPTGLLQLGYLVNNRQTHPFVLTFEDLTNLFVIGNRALDIYYTLLIQLCDDHHIPVLVLMGHTSKGEEAQICESPFWSLDLSTDSISFNLLDFGNGIQPTRQITILIELLETFAPLSSTARNLLHIILWKTFLTTTTPTLQYLQNIRPLYCHYAKEYHEIRRLLDALPHEILALNYETISLNCIQHIPTIISGSAFPRTNFAMNLLLLKLITYDSEVLPPLFLINPPNLNPSLLQWLTARYAATNSPLIFFYSQGTIPTTDLQTTCNFIVTNTPNSQLSLFHHHFTEDELLLLEGKDDHVAVRLRNEPMTRIVTIF